MPFSYTIREGTRADCTAAAHIWDTAQAARSDSAIPTETTTLELVTKRVDAGEAWLFMAEGDGQALGTAHALPARAKHGGGQTLIPGLLHISMVAVLPEYWGRGIGAALVTALLQKSRGSFTRAQLWTQISNTRAHDLYMHLGFVATPDQKIDDRGEMIQRYVISL